MLFDVGGADGNGSGRTEDLEELVDARQFRELRHEFFFVDQREESAFFERTHGSGGGFFERLIERVSKASSRDKVQDGREGHQNQGEGAAVPETESEAQRHQSSPVQAIA